MKHYFLRVKEIIQETSDTVTISFWHPLNEMLKYEAGQFLTVLANINGQKVRRSYSMSSSPQTDGSPAITVKRVTGGLVSNWLNDNTKVGYSMEVAEPMGHFFVKPDATNARTVVLIGAGSGITPLMAIAKAVLKVEAESRVILLYGNRNEESIIFKKQLADLQQVYGDRLVVKHTLSQPSSAWNGLSGRLNKTQIIRLLEAENVDLKAAEYYICGPEGLMDEAKTALNILGVATEKIHKESFASNHDKPEAATAEDSVLKTRAITILYEGSEYKLDVRPHQTILEAALELDIDLPYSCQAGMCTACMCKCTSGKVQLDEDDGLTESELKAGYILTCVGHPMTDDVVIEID